jgi:hypothetical protein
MFTPSGNSQLSSAANAAVTGLHTKQAAAVLATLFASHTYELKRDGVVIATGSGTGVVAIAEDVVVTGTATRPNGSTAADVLTGAWTVKIASASDSLIFATCEVSRQGKDGYIAANSIAATDTISYEIAVSALSPAPVGVQDVELGPNKYNGIGNTYIPYAENATAGALTNSVACRFRSVAGRWTSFVWAGVLGLSVSKNGAAFVALDSATPSISIAENDIFIFQRVAPQAGYNQNFTIYASGPAGGAGVSYPLVQWYINVVGASRAPQTFLLDGALGQEADATFHAGLVMGDVVEFKEGFTYKGFSPSISKVKYRTRIGATTRAKISAQNIDANYGLTTAQQAPYDAGKFLTFGKQFVYGIEIENLEFDGVAVPAASSHVETIGIRVLGCDWAIRDCYIHDFSMGVLSGDKHTGGLIFERNFEARCGRLSVFNGHSLYLNTSPMAFPDKYNIVQDNVFYDGTAQLLAHRTKSLVARNNWMFSNQDLSDGAEGTGVGTGKGGQTAISGGAPETEDCMYYASAADGFQYPSMQFYGNVIMSGQNTTPLSFGADSAGLIDVSNSLCLHNTIVLPAGFSSYAAYVRFNQAVHSAFLANNLFVASGGGARYAQNWVLETNRNPEGGKPAYFLIGNCVPVTADLGAAAAYINEVGTLFNNAPVLTNQVIGTVNAMPLSGSIIVGSAQSLASLPIVCRQNKSMPAVDLTRRTWAVMPTEASIAAGGKLIPPASGAINTNIGAL